MRNLFQIKDEATKVASTIDLHSAKLQFEGFVERNGVIETLTLPVFSSPIYNLSII